MHCWRETAAYSAEPTLDSSDAVHDPAHLLQTPLLLDRGLSSVFRIGPKNLALTSKGDLAGEVPVLVVQPAEFLDQFKFVG